MESYEGEESHPYGVLPAGNMYFATQQEIMTRYYGLGPGICKLTDELVGEMLSFLSGTDLISILQVSRTLYCHANSSDLWRDATLREYEGKGIKYSKCWKDAYMHTRVYHSEKSIYIKDHVPIRMKGIFSSFLHRMWSCHTCDLATACPGFFEQSDIPVREASDLTIEAFLEEYEIPNLPVVIRGAMLTNKNNIPNNNTNNNTTTTTTTTTLSYCPALEKWSNEYLSQQCGATKRLRATSAAAPLPAHFTAEEYFQYATQAKEEAPLYLFERNFAKIAPGLLHDYEVSKYFRASSSNSSNSSSSSNRDSINITNNSCSTICNTNNNSDCNNNIYEESKQSDGSNSTLSNHNARIPLIPSQLKHNPALIYETDLFRVLGEDKRPDYRWLVAGPARSGSLFHIDPNQTNAWNLCVRGRKKWIFYPPGVPPPGVECSADGADVVVPISTGEWLLTFWKYHLQARNDPNPLRRPLEVILNPGEVMFVPHGYWHMVVNLDESIALTHNYVSTSNLADCLRFLREKTDQISGVRDRGDVAIQPECLYTVFIDKLHTILPPHTIEYYIKESYKPCCIGINDINKTKLLVQRAQTLKRKRNGVQSTTTSASTNSNTTADEEVKTSEVSVPDERVEKSSFSFGFSF